MNKVKYKLNREWLNELLKHKNDSNVYFSLSDNDIRILLTYIDVLQSKIDKANKILDKHFQDDEGIVCKITGEYVAERNEKFIEELRDILKGEVN